MSIAERVAARHVAYAHGWKATDHDVCKCGHRGTHAGHVAEETEKEVRAFLHMQVREARDLDLSAWPAYGDVRFGSKDAYDTALAIIAKRQPD